MIVQVFFLLTQHLYVNQMLRTDTDIQELQIPPHFNTYLVINKCLTVLIFLKLLLPYLHNRSTLDIHIFGHINMI